ncbi:hypothetical protein [Pseudomonas syringae]|uniref:hypothetical protein n=1 Tax=Pseudomonas syringae TaxID=317 RepID=UPI000462F937|nr:hypothetical protein [Pseudomonas syringae]
MAFIVLHNSDSQGARAEKHFEGKNAILINVSFVENRISPDSMNLIRKAVMTNPGPNVVFWMGHGNSGVKVTANKGHPLTSPTPRCVNSQDLVDALTILNPERIYFMTCLAFHWVEREYQKFYATMRFLPRRVKIYAARVSLPGFWVKPAVDAILSGVENPSGVKGVAHFFESIEVYGESFIQWQQRTGPVTSREGFKEAPF